MSKIFIFKTSDSDTIIGEIVDIKEDLSLYYIKNPIKIITQIHQLRDGSISSSSIPVLFLPFCGDNIHIFKTDYFTSVTSCNEYDFMFAWYYEAVNNIMRAEIIRIDRITTEEYKRIYPDKYIHASPNILQ